MSEVITFRPTAETQDILARVKAEGGNISKFINKAIANGEGIQRGQCSVLYSFFPEESRELVFSPELTGMPIGEYVAFHTSPVGSLSVKRYKEFINVLKKEGLQHFYFRIDDDHTIGIVAPNREEASMALTKYYIYDRKNKEYDRTSAPLPQYRYHLASRTVVIIIREQL